MRFLRSVRVFALCLCLLLFALGLWADAKESPPENIPPDETPAPEPVPEPKPEPAPEPEPETLVSAEVSFTYLGRPYGFLTPKARNPWDMRIHNGYLYVGAGDYGLNLHPGVLRRMSLESGLWEDAGEVPDEQIDRFLLLSSGLAFPGIDPTGDWTLGNYYTVDPASGLTVTHRVLPGGIHNFDLAEFEGRLYAGLGVDQGECPLVCAPIGEETFTPVPFRKNGVKLTFDTCTTSRVYDLFVFRGELYAFLSRYYEGDTPSKAEIYRMKDGEMVFLADWKEPFRYTHFRLVPLENKLLYNDSYYFSAGRLYVSNDMKNLIDCTPADVRVVVDMALGNDGAFYLLGADRTEDGSYRHVLYRMDGQSGAFVRVLSFRSGTLALSFAVEDGFFYVGLGERRSDSVHNGEIFRAPLP